MNINKIINLKKYFLFSLIPIVIVSLFLKGQNEYLGSLIIIGSAFLNQLTLALAVGELINHVKNHKETQSISKKRMIFLFLFKFIILFLGLYFGFQFMGKRIILPLLAYVVMIFCLALSIRKIND